MSGRVLTGHCSSSFFSVVPAGDQLVPCTRRMLSCLTPGCGLCVLSGNFERLRSHGVHSSNVSACFGGVVLSRSLKIVGP